MLLELTLITWLSQLLSPPLFSLRLLSQPLPFLLLSQLLCHMLVSPSLDILLVDFLLWP